MKMGEEINLTVSKEKLTDLMEKRHQERQINLINMNELKLKKVAINEDKDYFTESFIDQFRKVENNLNNLKHEDTAHLTTKSNNVANSIQELQNYLSSSTLFLPDYNIKASQRRINELLVNLEETKAKLLPKKKFGFRAKQLAPTSKIIKDQQNETSIIKPELRTKQHIDWTVQNKTGQEIILDNDDVNNKDLTISTLNDCLLQIIGHPGSLQVSNLKNCILICGPIARSMFADNCTDCTFLFGCQQFRLHSSTNCNIYMHVTCRGIIEDCTKISVAPYNYRYPNIDIDFISSGLDVAKNNWTDVADFNWLSTDRLSPNWKILNEVERITDWISVIEKYRQEFHST